MMVKDYTAHQRHTMRICVVPRHPLPLFEFPRRRVGIINAVDILLCKFWKTVANHHHEDNNGDQ